MEKRLMRLVVLTGGFCLLLNAVLCTLLLLPAVLLLNEDNLLPEDL